MMYLQVSEIVIEPYCSMNGRDDRLISAVTRRFVLWLQTLRIFRDYFLKSFCQSPELMLSNLVRPVAYSAIGRREIGRFRRRAYGKDTSDWLFRTPVGQGRGNIFLALTSRIGDGRALDRNNCLPKTTPNFRRPAPGSP